MDTQIKILIVEDNKSDLFLLLNHLKHHWGKVDYEQVDTLNGVTQALTKEWDVIICDFYLQTFDGLMVLKMVNELGVKTPFILLSGEVPEDIAAAMLRLGAADYVMKDNLKRLVPVINRELSQTPKPAPDHNSPQAGSIPKIGAQIAESEAAKSKELNRLLTRFYPDNAASSDIKILERHRAVVNIMYVANLIKNYQHKVLEQYNLTEQQLTVLRFLKRIYPEASSMSLLKENSVSKTSDISRIIQRMVTEGLIIYHVSSNDKRVRDILISEKGLHAINEVDKVADQMFLPETYLSEQDAIKVNEALAKTLRIME